MTLKGMIICDIMCHLNPRLISICSDTGSVPIIKFIFSVLDVTCCLVVYRLLLKVIVFEINLMN